MSSKIYAVRKYYSCNSKELIAMFITAFFAGFILTFNDWGEEAFDIVSGLTNWGLTTVFLLFIIFCAVTLSKVIAIAFGYLIEYEYHLIGMLGGAFICVASAGYLPIFIPGGFTFHHHKRLRLGKNMGMYKGWELGVIAAMFPIAVLLFVLVLNPLYLLTEHEFYSHLLTAVCLTALYAMIPIPMFMTGDRGNVSDWWKYMKGCTFGLEVFYSSSFWYIVLTFAILTFCLLTWLITELGGVVGLLVYLIALVLALAGIWVYKKFFRH